MNKTNTKIKKISRNFLAVTNVARVIIYIIMAIWLFLSIVAIVYPEEANTAIIGWIQANASEFLIYNTVAKLVFGEVLTSVYTRGIVLLGSGGILPIAEIQQRNIINLIMGFFILIFDIRILHHASRILKNTVENDTPFHQTMKKEIKILFILLTLSMGSSLLVIFLMCITFYCIYQVFAYACELQQQSDETL